MAKHQVDLALVRELVEPARSSYTKAFGEAAPTLTVSAYAFLPPPPKGDNDDEGASW